LGLDQDIAVIEVTNKKDPIADFEKELTNGKKYVNPRLVP